MATAEKPSELERLRRMIADGTLHHVTYRCQGTLWEGLWFYRRAADGFRGYEVAGCVGKDSPDIEAAHAVVAGIGVHVGAYGCG